MRQKLLLFHGNICTYWNLQRDLDNLEKALRDKPKTMLQEKKMRNSPCQICSNFFDFKQIFIHSKKLSIFEVYTMYN